MVAAFLCGVLYGWLVRNVLVTAHNKHVLAETLPLNDDEYDAGPYSTAEWPVTFAVDPDTLDPIIKGVSYDTLVWGSDVEHGGIGD